MKPSVRASPWFRAVQQVVTPTPQEVIIADAMAYVAGSGVPGDYLEFGVYRGATLATAYHAARRHGLDSMAFYGFDSFAGMPATSPAQQSFAGDQHRQGVFAASAEECRRLLDANRVDPARVRIVPGWFDDVLTEEARRNLGIVAAAVILADCSLYESTVAALAFAVPTVQDGTLLAFGDWFSFRGSAAYGQHRAFDEWLAAHPTVSASPFQRFGWHGNSFVLHRAG